METDIFGNKKKERKLGRHPELVELIKHDYLSGKYTIASLAIKYDIGSRSIFHRMTYGDWRGVMERGGVPIPKEPKPPMILHSEETWTRAEAAFMKNKPLAEISSTFGISLTCVTNRARKYKWRYYRDQMDIAKRKKTDGSEAAERMEEFDDISARLITAAIDQLQKMLDEFHYTKKNMNPEKLASILKMHTSLYESVKKIPIQKQKPARSDVHPALRPAKIINM